MSETVLDVVKEEKEPTSDKEKFLELVISIEREYMDKELLLKQLNNSDFFTAPASVKYHDAEEGGLCRHSLAAAVVNASEKPLHLHRHIQQNLRSCHPHRLCGIGCRHHPTHRQP